jgi:hypothetical protein
MKELDAEEKELLESYERDEWQSVANLKSESDRYRGYVGRGDQPVAPTHRRTKRATSVSPKRT